MISYPVSSHNKNELNVYFCSNEPNYNGFSRRLYYGGAGAGAGGICLFYSARYQTPHVCI